MKAFTQDIVSYLKENRICVLAVQMLDGTPHASTVHFAYDDVQGCFIFETYREYRKLESFAQKADVPASLVVGTDEQIMKTLQVDGISRMVTDTDGTLKAIYMKTFPEKQGKYEENKLVFFTLTPRWWRFTDWTHPEGKRIENSE